MKDFLKIGLLYALGIFFIVCFITIFTVLMLGIGMYYEWLKEFIT